MWIRSHAAALVLSRCGRRHGPYLISFFLATMYVAAHACHPRCAAIRPTIAWMRFAALRVTPSSRQDRDADTGMTDLGNSSNPAASASLGRSSIWLLLLRHDFRHGVDFLCVNCSMNIRCVGAGAHPLVGTAGAFTATGSVDSIRLPQTLARQGLAAGGFGCVEPSVPRSRVRNELPEYYFCRLAPNRRDIHSIHWSTCATPDNVRNFVPLNE